MKNFTVAVSSCVAAAAFVALMLHSSSTELRAQEKAKAAPKGKAPIVDTLGPGPWDLKTETGTVHVSVVTKGLDHPWGMQFLPNGDILITERAGRLRVFRNGVLDPNPISGLPPIRALSLGGLMDIALHPNFAQNRLIYFAYSKPGDEDPAHATLAVGRARWDGGPALADVKDIFVADGYHGGRNAAKVCCGQGPSDASYGSRLVFDRAGLLYITSGDRNYGEKSQDPASHIGKILRLRDDGTVPPDNPFVGKEGYKPEIYSLGHRNQLGLTLNTANGEIWESEFGPSGGDEINKIEAGKDYGWITVTRGEHYNKAPSEKTKAGMVDPVLFFIPSINPGNLVIYNADRFPAWKGNILMGTMSKSLYRAKLDAKNQWLTQERMLTELNQRFRDTRVGPDGLIYLLTDETFGALLKVEPGR